MLDHFIACRGSEDLLRLRELSALALRCGPSAPTQTFLYLLPGAGVTASRDYYTYYAVVASALTLPQMPDGRWLPLVLPSTCPLERWARILSLSCSPPPLRVILDLLLLGCAGDLSACREIHDHVRTSCQRSSPAHDGPASQTGCVRHLYFTAKWRAGGECAAACSERAMKERISAGVLERSAGIRLEC